MKRRARYDPGPPCAVCGLTVINVVHDDPVTRQRNIEQWAGPNPAMDGKDYYTWADIKYHAYVPQFRSVEARR